MRRPTFAAPGETPACRLPLAAFRALAARIATLGWSLELLARVDEHGLELAALAELPVPVAFGPMGYLTVGRGVDSQGFIALLGSMRVGQAWSTCWQAGCLMPSCAQQVLVDNPLSLYDLAPMAAA